MTVRILRALIVSAALGSAGLCAAVSLHGAAAVSRQQADVFERKIDTIERHGAKSPRPAQRTPVTESEINSWFAYRSEPVLPDGLTKPALTIAGNGKVSGTATLDLDAVAKARQSGRTFDIWNLVGGQMPVTVEGIVRTRGGRGRFELQEAWVSGVPVPRRVVQELLSYYSRTPGHPSGRRLDEDFELPAGIQSIEMSPGAAVVVQ
jgi:hypothetical protein